MKADVILINSGYFSMNVYHNIIVIEAKLLKAQPIHKCIIYSAFSFNLANYIQ